MSRRRRRRSPAYAGPLVSFACDDAAGAWRKGDAAVDLGWESLDEHGEPATDVRLLRLLATGELLSLSDPYGRGLIDTTVTT
jgi:hypothetical protein